MLQFIGPALRGASLIGRYGIPLVQQAGIAAGMAGIGAGVSALTNKPQAKPQPTGRQKLTQAWGRIPDDLNAKQGGGFGYLKGRQPNYSDAQGNVYDAVSGRLLYAAPARTTTGSTGSRPAAGGSPAAERAFQAEKSRVAQLTAQDPELQRYEKASAAAKTQEEMNAARDIGMQIWQQKYGKTPMAQPGGAIGSFNPLMDRTFGYQAGMSPGQLATAAPIQVAPGAIPYEKGDLGTRATLETGYDPAAYGLTPEVIEETKRKLLQQAR
jgi:hypothetical protein